MQAQRDVDSASVLGKAQRHPLPCRPLAYCLVIVFVLLGGLIACFEPERAAHGALPHSLRPFRPIPIRLGNAFHLFLRQLGVKLMHLDAEELIDAACTRHQSGTASKDSTVCDFGIDEFGDFREGLAVFVNSLEAEAALTLIGRIIATRRISMILDQRLQLVAYWRGSHSQEVSHTPVTSPVFVVGLPRTGTSFLHTLLSQDTERFHSPLNWMVVDPVPPLYGSIDEAGQPVALGLGGDSKERIRIRSARIAEATSNLNHFKSLAPNIDAQHKMTAFRPGRIELDQVAVEVEVEHNSEPNAFLQCVLCY